MARLRPEQWADIHAEWIGTDKPVREMARAHGVDHKTILERAQAKGWGPRNASARKREIVAADLAGAYTPPHQSPRRGEDDLDPDAQAVEIAQDIEDMRLGVRVFRQVLRRCHDLSLLQLEPKDTNQTVDAARKAVDGIRRIRGLDEPAKPAQVIPVAYQALSDDELAKAIRDAGGI